MRSRRRHLLKILMVTFTFLALLAVWLGFGERGLFQLYRMGTERQDQIQRNRQLAEENQALMDEIERLRTDLEYMESVARKELGLIKDSEIVYRFKTGEPEIAENRKGLQNGNDKP